MTATAQPMTAARIRHLMGEHALRPRRSLGQHFVADPNTVRRIVRLAGVGAGSRVLEIGAGLGSLTTALVEVGAEVIAVEVDRDLVPILREVVGESARIVEADALRLDWAELLGQGARRGGGGDNGDRRSSWQLVANLPYNVATPLVVKVLEEAPQVRSLLVMVQREVGDRLAARPGDEAYGAVSVKVGYWATAEIAGVVPSTVFVPRPAVESALVRIARRDQPVVPSAEVAYGRLFAVVGAGFAHRRKMLRRALAGVVEPEAFAAAGVAPEARAENLGVEEWGRLAGWRPDPVT